MALIGVKTCQNKRICLEKSLKNKRTGTFFWDSRVLSFAGYLSQVHRETDYIVLVHCPEVAKLPTFSFKSKSHTAFYSALTNILLCLFFFMILGYLAQLHKPTDYLILVHIPEAPRLPTFSFKSEFTVDQEEWV